MDINPISLDYLANSSQDRMLTQNVSGATFTVPTVTASMSPNLTDAAAGQAYEVLLQGGTLNAIAPDNLSAMLSGVYRAPTLSLPLPAPSKRKEAPSKEAIRPHVVEPLAITHVLEYVSGNPSDAHGPALNPAAPEAMAAYHSRAAELSGQTPLLQRIQSGTHEALIQHHLDLIA